MTTISALLLQSDGAPGAGLLAVGSTMMIVLLAVAVVFIAALWKVFTKAGQPGWAVLIPIYNTILMLKIAGRPLWWILLLLVPLVNIAILFILAIDIAKAFGKSAAWGVILLGILGGIGYLILGFGSAQYQGARAAAATA